LTNFQENTIGSLGGTGEWAAKKNSLSLNSGDAEGQGSKSFGDIFRETLKQNLGGDLSLDTKLINSNLQGRPLKKIVGGIDHGRKREINIDFSLNPDKLEKPQAAQEQLIQESARSKDPSFNNAKSKGPRPTMGGPTGVQSTKNQTKANPRPNPHTKADQANDSLNKFFTTKKSKNDAPNDTHTKPRVDTKDFSNLTQPLKNDAVNLNKELDKKLNSRIMNLEQGVKISNEFNANYIPKKPITPFAQNLNKPIQAHQPAKVQA
jgi:hypothetical protein